MNFQTTWQLYNANVFSNIVTKQDIDNAAKQLTNKIISSFNASCAVAFSSNKIKPPPWETKEVREARAGIKYRLRQSRGTKSDKDWMELRSHQAGYHRLRNQTKNKEIQRILPGNGSKIRPQKDLQLD